MAELVNNTGESCICWCHLNDEGDMLERVITDAVQVAGKDTDERKTDVLDAFASGNIRVLVTKSRIAGLGLNFQHCAHQTMFPSHSFESAYQSIRRSWRFGQTRPVVIDVVASEGESDVMASLERKQAAADRMFESVVAMMNESLSIAVDEYDGQAKEVPAWLQ